MKNYQKILKVVIFKIDKILEGANWSRDLSSPLQELQVNAKVVLHYQYRYIQTNTVNDIYKLLIDKANKQVEIVINDKPNNEGAPKSS